MDRLIRCRTNRAYWIYLKYFKKKGNEEENKFNASLEGEEKERERKEKKKQKKKPFASALASTHSKPSYPFE
jgi:Sec-independent protein translocase protein TatA